MSGVMLGKSLPAIGVSARRGSPQFLDGGAGRDIFAFSIEANRHLVIADFRAGQDIVQFHMAAPSGPGDRPS